MTTDDSPAPDVQALPRAPMDEAPPPGFRLRLSLGTAVRDAGGVLVGGSPWKVSKVAPAVRDLVVRLRRSDDSGVEVESDSDRMAARVLLDRGFAEPAPSPPIVDRAAEVVIPVLESVPELRELLASLPELAVVVVDDGSRDPRPLALAVEESGGRIVRHESNKGPAAARNTGLEHTVAPFVAFIDVDCLAGQGWPRDLLHHFDDPRVGAVAPRIRPMSSHRSLLQRYEESRSSLDMGDRPELVIPGARLGFVPSAALVVRREALGDAGFDEGLRLGEDVDLVWRLSEAGWLVRYDPEITVRHRTRTTLKAWLRRKVDYGSSAASLDARHPGRLAPVRTSVSYLVALGCIAMGRLELGACAIAPSVISLRATLEGIPRRDELAVRIAAEGFVSSTHHLGQALRREWWPVGAVALAAAPRSRLARAAAVVMLAPVLWEWTQRRPAMDPVSFTAFRLLDDAAYGTGVLKASARARTWRTLTPSITVPPRLCAVMDRWLS